MSRSIARELRVRFGLIGAAGFLGLFFFVLLDADRYFDDRYQQFGMSGLGYEIADHVILPFVTLLLPIFIATAWIVSRALKPLALASDRVDKAQGSERGFRVDTRDLPEEAVPFATAVNGLLFRLDAAAERQEAFAADVAHELRTPLAIMILEVGKTESPLSEKLAEELSQMARLVDQLLMLAQLDADSAAPLPHEKIDLASIAADVVGRMAPIAIQQHKSLELEVCAEGFVRGRREVIATALRNLIENSIRVSQPGSAIAVFVGPGNQLRVRDSGPGVPAEMLKSLRQRHVRADNASAGGAGLGLSIVSKVMASHGGELVTDPVNRELILAFPSEIAGSAARTRR